MQKIYIKNNGPVKEFEMEINKFNILIGEQATGKSTIAKSVYFFRIIKTTIIDYLTQICDSDMYKNKPQHNVRFFKAISRDLKDIFVKLFGYSWELNPNLEMKYEFSEDIWIRVALYDGDRAGRKLIGVEYSTEIVHQIDELKRQVHEIYRTGSHIVTSLALVNEERKRNHEIIIQKVNDIFRDNRETYYIPAGRSLLTVMSGSRAMMNSVTNLDLITEKFMMMIDTIRNSFSNGLRRTHQYYPVSDRKFDVNEVAEMIVNMQKGEYFYSGGREFLKIREDVEHPVAINFASSGQQEILWLLNFLYVLLLRQENAFVIIEEPEAHIYPTLQKEVMEFISMFANMRDGGVFVTTHSPYILTAANNLYYAGTVFDLGREKQVKKVLGKKFMIKKDSLTSYKLLSANEKVEGKNYINLLDVESGEIKASLIDDVSEEINEMYTALYDIQLDCEWGNNV